MLVAIAALFLGSFVLAGALRFSGWRPQGLKNKGELLQPPGDLRALAPTLADGASYRWDPAARRWRIVVAAPRGCAAPCTRLAHELDTVRQLFTKDASRVDIAWLDALPPGVPAEARQDAWVQADAVRRALPRAGAAAGPVVYVVDPNGFAILRYAPGFDPGDLRTDLARLLKLR